jgi:hypothetical protein
LYNDKGRFYLDSRKLRSLENNMSQLPIPNSFTSFIEKYVDMLKKDCKRKGVDLPPFYWLQKSGKGSTSAKEDKPKTSTKQPRAAKEEVKEEEEEEGTIEL